MSNDDTRRIISKVLNIENSAAWEVISSDPDQNLYMVHHKPEADLTKYGDIRGIVVDTKAETIVSRSYGYTPTVVTNEIPNSLNLVLTDQMGMPHTLNTGRCLIKTGFEGTVINVFKHNGVVYRTTRKRLDAGKSRWGNSKTFMEMYWSLGGPSDNILFDSQTKYSPYVHTFIIVHPDVLVVSKDNIGNGYLVYLGVKQMWSLNYDECPYKQTNKDGTLMVSEDEWEHDQRVNAGWIDETLHVPETVSDLKADTTYLQGGVIYAPPNLSLNEANKHLMFGFYDPFEGFHQLDQRLLPGEFVIIQQLDETDAVSKMFKIESVAYNWRLGMRDNNPNLKHRFFQLINGSYLRYDTAEGKSRYEALYPYLTSYDKESIKAQVKEEPYVVWPQGQLPVLKGKESLMYNIWLAFLNTVPLHNQRDASSYLDYLYGKRDELIAWLRNLENQGHIDASLFSRRVLDVIEAGRKFAQQRVHNGQDRDRNGKKLSVKDMTKENIRNLIMKEEGNSLYRLIREMDAYKKEQELLQTQ